MKAKMTAAQKRVAIARDVIKQLKIKLTSACHLYFWGEIDDIIGGANPLSDVRELIKKSNVKENLCEVCAKGALVIAHILRFNGVNVSDFRRAENRIGNESPIPYFSDRQFNLIEALYEGNGVDDDSSWRKFYRRIDCLFDEERIIAIMKEIIRRKGDMK